MNISRVLIVLAAFSPAANWSLLPASGAAPAPDATRADAANPFVAPPGETVLLLGDPTVARTSNLTQRFFPATKHPANPVLRRTEPWEGVGPYVWGNRLM